MSKRVQHFTLVAVLTALLGTTGSVVAEEPHCPLSIQGIPLLGGGTTMSEGWMSVGVRLQNPTNSSIAGTLELVSSLPWAHSETRHSSRAPFSVAAKATIHVELLSHVAGGSAASGVLTARDHAGSTLCTLELAAARVTDPLLFDLTVPSRLSLALREEAVPLSSFAQARRGPASPLLAVTSPLENQATGDPILPKLAAGYAPATVVLASSKQLGRVSAAELHALGGWVLAGGSLAIVVSRPEDLRASFLVALLGGPVQPAPVPSKLREATEFLTLPDASSPTPAPYPTNQSFLRYRAVPSPELSETLVGFAGHNLKDSPWGASASYGLGEVHLLAFDATSDRFLNDAWARLKIVDLVRHSYERKQILALPHAQVAIDEHQASPIRRLLDPNEGTRWTIAVSAVLLLLYAILAGPVSFYRAARQGRPQRALLLLPIWAGAMMLVLVLLGMIGKGLEGRARRLTLVEAGAGMSRAAATRFRGLFAASAGQLTVWAVGQNSVLDVIDDAAHPERVLVLDRRGARLEGVQAKPWQTVLVREDSFLSLGGGVSIAEGPGGDLFIKNRAARDLVAAIVSTPSGHTYFFPRIEDGSMVAVTSGRQLTSAVGIPTPGALTPLGAADFASDVDREAAGLGAAWRAIEALSDAVDWWPADVPTLIAELEGGDGKVADSGLKLDMDRVLLRVVGYGGTL